MRCAWIAMAGMRDENFASSSPLSLSSFVKLFSFHTRQKLSVLTLKWARHIFGCCYYTFIMQFSQTGKSWLHSRPYFVKWPITSMTVFSAWICPPVVRVGIGPAVANLHMHKYMSYKATIFSPHYAVAIVIINQSLLWFEGEISSILNSEHIDSKDSKGSDCYRLPPLLISPLFTLSILTPDISC